MLGEAGLLQLLPLLPYMPALDTLILDANSLGTRGARALARALLRGRHGGVRGGKRQQLVRDGQEAAVPSTEEGAMLVEEQEQEQEAPDALSPPSTPCLHLRVLSLALNGIGAGGAAELAAALVPCASGGASPCQTLEVLNLDGNVLGPSGTAALARCVLVSVWRSAALTDAVIDRWQYTAPFFFF